MCIRDRGNRRHPKQSKSDHISDHNRPADICEWSQNGGVKQRDRYAHQIYGHCSEIFTGYDSGQSDRRGEEDLSLIHI